jgi:hypothetical protein
MPRWRTAQKAGFLLLATVSLPHRRAAVSINNMLEQ